MAGDVFAAGGRGRGRQGGGRPLSGNAFFLDVRGQTRPLENDLRGLGGTVEKFLSKDVDYVITNRSQSTPRKTDEKFGRRARSAEYSRGKAMVTRSHQSKQPEVRSYAVGVAAKWAIRVKTLEEVKDWISQQKAAGSLGKTPGRAGRTAPSRQLEADFIKVEDKTGKYQPVVKRPSGWPHTDFTPSTGSPFADAIISPPTTRSGGRRKNASSQPTPGSSTSSAGRTTRQRAGKVTLGASPALKSPRKPTPRSSRKPLTALVAAQPSVHFQLAKIPPASELIPKAKPLKKTNVTMKKVKRQLDFDDIVPSPAPMGKTKAMNATKKMTVLMELQDRLDGISREDLSPKHQAPRRQPARGRKASPSPSPRKVTVARLARQLKKELQQNSQQISPMSLRNGKVKFAAY